MNIGLTIAATLVNVLEVLLFIRAVMSLIPFEDENPIEQFLIMLTEPYVMPFRLIFDKLNINPSIPLDLPYFACVIFTAVIGLILETLA